MDKNIQAVIDIGSNSVRLLVADCKDGLIVPIHKGLNTTRLSKGLSLTHQLSDVAIERTLNAIYEFNIKAVELGANEIYCFATAAVRNAENVQGFIELVKERTALDVEVLSKKGEAQMGFIGVDGEGNRGILDIGGGSTEIAIGDGENTLQCSMDLGAVTALDLYPLGNIADELTLEAMQQWTNSVMSNKASEVLLNSQDVEFVGIGGTITTLMAIELQMTKYDPARIQGKKLTVRIIEKWYNSLIKMPLITRRTLTGINPERADIIIGGVSILLTFMKLFSLKEIRVSDSGILEGYLKTKIDDNTKEMIIDEDLAND
ncbi:MAG: hypothetical protein KAQ68_09125 [Clostridiales bacterium]|nr:hypothetical protein [Clostridiales bacterium]